jgi:uridine phosphorylase
MSHGEPIHIRPTAPLAERVLLPGDPGRALALSQQLLQEPKMFNLNRGLWGYTGTAADGAPLTIQSTGMGGPSAAIVFTELIELGARRAIRVGSCGGLAPELALGDLVIGRASICADGTSQALGAGPRATADEQLSDALAAAAPDAHAGTIASVDLFHEPRPSEPPAEAMAIEMEAATLFALGALAGLPVACMLVVSDTFPAAGERERIGDEAMLESAGRMGAAALAALAV